MYRVVGTPRGAQVDRGCMCLEPHARTLSIAVDKVAGARARRYHSLAATHYERHTWPDWGRCGRCDGYSLIADRLHM
jgi:hypothetical protein